MRAAAVAFFVLHGAGVALSDFPLSVQYGAALRLLQCISCERLWQCLGAGVALQGQERLPRKASLAGHTGISELCLWTGPALRPLASSALNIAYHLSGEASLPPLLLEVWSELLRAVAILDQLMSWPQADPPGGAGTRGVSADDYHGACPRWASSLLAEDTVLRPQTRALASTTMVLCNSVLASMSSFTSCFSILFSTCSECW